MMTIEEFNSVYKMYASKTNEELAMLLTIRDYNEDKENSKTDKNIKKCPLDDPDMFRVHPDTDMFKIHPEDGPIYVDPSIITTPMINSDDFCWWTKNNKCVRGSNKCCDGCGHFPRTYVTCEGTSITVQNDNITTTYTVTGTDKTINPNC